MRPARGTTSAAPAGNAISSSMIEASKLDEENCRTRESGVMPSRSIWAPARLVMPTCETTTPFGVPVEPEV